MEGVEWEWQDRGGVMTKAPLGKDATAKNPTDRAKKIGTNKAQPALTDGAGMPLAVGCRWSQPSRLQALPKLFLAATLDGIVVARPVVSGEHYRHRARATPEQPQHLCAWTRRLWLREGTRRSALTRLESRTSALPPARRKRKVRRFISEVRQGSALWVVERTHIRGSIAPGGCWCAGRKRPRTTWRLCTLPAPNSSSPSCRFPDKDLVLFLCLFLCRFPRSVGRTLP